MTAKVPPPGAHGGDGVLVAQALGMDPHSLLDLSQSLNPLAPDVAAVISNHLDALHRYPDACRTEEVLAEAIGVDRNRLLLTNGGAEAIALVTKAIGGSVVEPDFALLPRGAGPLWRSNPHSPSGLLAGADETAHVWDEAYYPLATGRWTRGDSAVVGSLTKIFACPGLRLGYVLAEPSLIESCRAEQALWSVNSLAIAALPDLLDLADLPGWSRTISDLRNSLVGVLAQHGLLARDSDANWVLVEMPGLRAALAPAGVLVRDCASFGLPDVFRIAVPDADGLEVLDQALNSIDRAFAAGGTGR